MPYRSKKKRRLYSAKWRRKHPTYMREYNEAYYHDEPPKCLLGRKVKTRMLPPVPTQSGKEISSGLKLPNPDNMHGAADGFPGSDFQP